MDMKKETIFQRDMGIFLLLGFLVILAVVKETKLHIFFDNEILKQGLATLLSPGGADNPKLRFYLDYALPVQRVTFLLACGALVFGWYWFLKSFRNKVSWRHIAGGISAVSLSLAALVYFEFSFTGVGTLDPPAFGFGWKHVIDFCLRYEFVLPYTAVASTFFGAGRWRIAFVLALEFMCLIWLGR